MTTEEMLEELLRQMHENNKKLEDLNERHNKLRDDYYRIERIALEDNEYVQGQKRIIAQIEQMLPEELSITPDTDNWLSPGKRLFKIVE